MGIQGAEPGSPCARHLKARCLIWSLKQPLRKLEFVLPILQTRKQGWRDKVFCPKPGEPEVVGSLSGLVHCPCPSFSHHRACPLTAPQPQEPSSIQPAPGVELTDHCVYIFSSNHSNPQPRCCYYPTRELRLGKVRWRFPGHTPGTDRCRVRMLGI